MSTDTRLQAERVTNRTDYGQGYSETQFGFCIGGRVFWCGMEGYGHDQRQADESKVLCMEIIRRLNAAPSTEALPIEPEREK